ncbi:MAG: helix-hairpin-helix domain-containing protein [Methylococcaceae bacterium]
MTNVTFTLPSDTVGNATGGILLGDFNHWNQADGIVLEKQKNGDLQATLPLEVGKYYEYRYLLSDGRWVNDEYANPYMNTYGHCVENCSLIVPTDVKESAVQSSGIQESAVPSLGVQKTDDLTKIEGIGKKIAELLVAQHICTFADLANSKNRILQNILNDAGSRYKSYDPNTWVEQAKLASEGKWDELKTLQLDRKNAKKAS